MRSPDTPPDPDRPPRPRRGVTRRRLLIGGGAGVGLLVAYVAWPSHPPLNLAAFRGEHILNAWVKIGEDDSVTIVVPQTEQGQGVYTSLPMVLADELGADWSRIAVEPAPLHVLYANAQLVADAPGDGGPLDDARRWYARERIAHDGVQATLGSTSMRQYFQPLRQAGAAARVALSKAAGADWGVDWRQCDVEAGKVRYRDKVKTFGELAVLAARQRVGADEASLKNVALLDIIGRSVPRLDVPAKLNGQARFAADVRLPGMVYASLRPTASPSAVAVRAARGRPGVISVLSLPNWTAVVAEGWWQAEQAAQLLGHDATLAPDPLPALLKALDGPMETLAARGNPGNAAGGRTVDARITVGPLLHAGLEPLAATARVASERVELWAPVNCLTLATRAVARALDVPEKTVSIYPTLSGVGPGRAMQLEVIRAAAQLSRLVGKPVQLQLSRAVDFALDQPAPALAVRVSGALDASGAIASWDQKTARVRARPGAAERYMPTIAALLPDHEPNVAGLPQGYALPAGRFAEAKVDGASEAGYYQAAAHQGQAFVSESVIDLLAERAGADPLAFRAAHLAGAPRALGVLRAAGRRADYREARQMGRGQGVALFAAFGSVAALVLEVALTPGAPVQLLRATCALDAGRIVHPDIVRGQIEGGIIRGLSDALYGVARAAGGKPPANFDDYPLLSLGEAPAIEVVLTPSHAEPGGVSGLGALLAPAALANAIARAGGVRVMHLPIGGQTVL